MKLYFSPGACSMASHIVAKEVGLSLELAKVDLKAHKTESGEDFYEINPRGYVPALEVEGLGLLTENIAVLVYLASQKPDANLLPKAGSNEYFRAIEWLNFVGSEFHKGIGLLAFKKPDEQTKKFMEERVSRMLGIADETLAQHDYVNGAYSAADAYLFTVLRWVQMTDIKISDYPNVEAFMQRMAARKAVQEAMRDEGVQDQKKAA